MNCETFVFKQYNTEHDMKLTTFQFCSLSVDELCYLLYRFRAVLSRYAPRSNAMFIAYLIHPLPYININDYSISLTMRSRLNFPDRNDRTYMVSYDLYSSLCL